ncbi:MAG: hypothetical protein Homavirus16_3 [Homavirus sp.]|uniref:Uncharacterized protein n=1 Tax=Homavirus sp. TaxID=2487769 RepID=A0A3G5A6U2_9VIRU|nr:MAG: hypothetical protein Homavirus16_3 [Homavirus sp.]
MLSNLLTLVFIPFIIIPVGSYRTTEMNTMDECDDVIELKKKIQGLESLLEETDNAEILKNTFGLDYSDMRSTYVQDGSGARYYLHTKTRAFYSYNPNTRVWRYSRPEINEKDN